MISSSEMEPAIVEAWNDEGVSRWREFENADLIWEAIAS